MNPSEEQFVRRWSAEVNSEIRLALLVTGDPRSEKLAEFCDRLAGFAPRVSVEKKKLDTDGPPAIGILTNLRYHGVPEENELAPFLETVFLATGNGGSGVDFPADLERIELPARLELYVAAGCRHCPSMVRSLAPIAVGNDKVYLDIVDAALFQEAADAESIRSVPTLLLDGKFRFNGVVPVSEVMQMLISRDPIDVSPSVLLSLIEEGDAGKVADLMLAHEVVFPALIDLLTDERWPRRLGAMVALESVAEIDSVLAAAAAPALIKRLDSVSDAVKGDILYLLGEIGDTEVVPLLKRFAEDDAFAELSEAAAEALTRIQAK